MLRNLLFDIDVPIFHVNSEDPEAVLFVTELAYEFRQTFHKDVVIDMGQKRGRASFHNPAVAGPLTR